MSLEWDSLLLVSIFSWAALLVYTQNYKSGHLQGLGLLDHLFSNASGVNIVTLCASALVPLFWMHDREKFKAMLQNVCLSSFKANNHTPWFFPPLSLCCSFFTPLHWRTPSEDLKGVPTSLEKRWLKRHRTVRGRWGYGAEQGWVKTEQKAASAEVKER